MTDFAKVQSYAIKSAVIALAFADGASYLVMRRIINAPVVASEELVDSIDRGSPVRTHSEFAAILGEALPVPALAANDGIRQAMPPPLGLAEVGANTRLPLVTEQTFEEPARTKPMAAESLVIRASASARVPARHRAGKMAFSRAFADFLVANEGAGSACKDDADIAANLDCPPDLVPNNAASTQASASQDSRLNLSDQANELPAVIGKAASLDAEDRTGSEPDPQSWDRDVTEHAAPPPADAALPNARERQDLGSVQPAALRSAADMQATTHLDGADPVALNLIAGASLARAEWLTPASMSQADRLKVLTTRLHQPMADTNRKGYRALRAKQQAAAPARVPDVSQTQVALATASSARAALQAGPVVVGSTSSVDRDLATISASPHSDSSICLRDVLKALRPLMDSAEFERLIHSRHSATVFSITTLRAAGIAIAYDAKSDQLSFT